MVPDPRKILAAAALSAALLASIGLCAESAPNGAIRLLPGDMKWGPPSGPQGLQTVTLAGNPDVPGPYAERIRLPAGTRLAPHSHPNEARMVTVLSGTLYYGTGTVFDESKLAPLPAGSFFTEPKDAPHYALAREEVILQLNANGPAGTRFVEETKQIRVIAGGKP